MRKHKKEVIEVRSSPFYRSTSEPVPGIPEDWDAIKKMDAQQLREIGCRAFDKPEMGFVLMLLPGEWHVHLPKGLKLECIDGQKVTVGVDYIDDDIRFGLLAYGLRVRAGAK